MTEIKLLTSDGCKELLDFKQNESRRKEYFLPNFNAARFKYLKAPSGISLPSEFELIPGPDSKLDCENSIAIFTALKGLDRIQASDKRLWVSLTHDLFFEYSKSRWIKNESYSEGAIVTRFHFEGNGLNTRMRNSIARLWWGAKLTYDDKLEDPFGLTREFWRSQDVLQGLMERRLGLYPHLLRSILEFQRNQKLKDEDMRLLFKSVNAIGGVKSLAFLKHHEVLALLEDCLLHLKSEAQASSKYSPLF